MKWTKEQVEQMRDTVRTEGWAHMRDYLLFYARILEEQMASPTTGDMTPDVAAIYTYKMRFGLQALASFFNDMDNIAKGLDKKED